MLKMSKKLLLVALLICVLVVQAPFIMAGGNEPIEFKIAVQDASTMKIGDTTINHPHYAMSLAFKNALEQYSHGKFKVEIYTNARLGDSKSTLEQVLMGNIGAASVSDAQLSPFYKNVQVFMAPFTFKDPNQLYTIVDGAFGKKFFNDMAVKSGLRALTSYVQGIQSFTTTKKLVKVPADMKGMKIRTAESQLHMEVVKAVGAAPVPIAWLEVYSALQTGVADGQVNIPNSVLVGSLYEVQKYYTVTNHVYSLAYLLVSEKYLKSLSPELQQAFKKAGKEASAAGRNAVRDVESHVMETLKQKGMVIYYPTTAEMKLWRQTSKSGIEWLKRNTDPKLVDELLKAVKKAK
jgi:tripartite ATP-independent transporter DctP family solute receptor